MRLLIRLLMLCAIGSAAVGCFPAEQRGDRIIATYTFIPPTSNPIVRDVASGASVPLRYAGLDTNDYGRSLPLETDCTGQFNGRYCPASPPLDWISNLSQRDQSYLGYWQEIGRILIEVAEDYAARGQYEKARQGYRGALDIFGPLNRIGLSHDNEHGAALAGYTRMDAMLSSSNDNDEVTSGEPVGDTQISADPLEPTRRSPKSTLSPEIEPEEMYTINPPEIALS